MTELSDRDGNWEAFSANGAGSSEPLMTAGDVATLLGVTRSWVYEQSRLGRIPTVTLGRYRRYRRAAIEAWVRELEQAERTGDLVQAGGSRA